MDNIEYFINEEDNMNDWFPHSFQRRNSKEMLKVKMLFGLNGVGVFYCLEEMLYESGGKMELSDIECIAYSLHTESEYILKIISSCFEKDETHFWCQSVINTLKDMQERYEKRVLAAKQSHVRGVRRANAEQMQSNAEQMQSNAEQMQSNAEPMQEQCPANTLHYITLHNNTEHNNDTDARTRSKKVKPEFIPPTIEEVKAYFTLNGFTEALATRFFEGYNVANWFDSQNKKISNWKQKAQQVWFRKEQSNVVNAGKNGQNFREGNEKQAGGSRFAEYDNAGNIVGAKEATGEVPTTAKNLDGCARA
jgi:hypothetical protein